MTATTAKFQTGEEIIWNGARAVIDEIKGSDYYLTIINPDGSEGFQMVEAQEAHLMEKVATDTIQERIDKLKVQLKDANRAADLAAGELIGLHFS